LLNHVVLLAGLLQDVLDPPTLLARERPGLHDPHHVTHGADVLLVVGFIALGPLDDLLIESMGELAGHLDHHRLVHLVAHHYPDTGLAARSGLSFTLAHRLGLLPGCAGLDTQLFLADNGVKASDLALYLTDPGMTAQSARGGLK